MTTYGERTDFFGVADDRVIYDERKKRFVHTKELPGHLARQYYSSGFKTVSSDFFEANIDDAVFPIIAKTRSRWPRSSAVQDQTAIRPAADPIHELSNQARNEKDVENHGPHVLQLLLRKCA